MPTLSAWSIRSSNWASASVSLICFSSIAAEHSGETVYSTDIIYCVILNHNKRLLQKFDFNKLKINFLRVKGLKMLDRQVW